MNIQVRWLRWMEIEMGYKQVGALECQRWNAFAIGVLVHATWAYNNGYRDTNETV